MKHECALCGTTDGEIRMSLVEWREPTAGNRFEAVLRCRDVEACRRRVQSVLKEAWPITDAMWHAA